MNLREYQQAVRDLSFGLPSTPPSKTQVALPAFALYREMIRSRFAAMAQVAFRASWSLLGDAACSASFARYLAEESPSSPILREVIAGFGDFALRDRVLLGAAPGCAADLMRFETAKWQVASDGTQLPSDCTPRELDFDGVLVCNPTLRRLALTHDVSASSLHAVPEDPHTLLVYRRHGEDDVHWYRAPSVLSDLLSLAHASGAEQTTVGEHVQQLFAGRAGDDAEPLLEGLASALTVAVERGVLLGVRD